MRTNPMRICSHRSPDRAVSGCYEGEVSGETFYERAYDVEAHETRDFYARWAPTYDDELTGDNAYAQPRRCADALEAVVADRRARILDAGCGTGLVGAELARRSFQTLDGCDYSPEMLGRARNRDVYRGLFSADLNQPLPLSDASYDAVMAVGVFSFGHVLPDALDELCRVVAPGGPIVIGVNDHYYDEGSLVDKIERLASKGTVAVTGREHGDHMPGAGVGGWVLVVVRA